MNGLRKTEIYTQEEVDKLFPGLSKLMKSLAPNLFEDDDEETHKYNVFVYETLRYPPNSTFNTNLN